MKTGLTVINSSHFGYVLKNLICSLFTMKQFVIDELRPADYTKLKKYLDENLGADALEGIYWLPLEPEIFSGIQTRHKDCKPFYFAIDLEPDRVIIELLVRTKNRVRCACITYATEAQCTWLMRRIDQIFEQLGIIY